MKKEQEIAIKLIQFLGYLQVQIRRKLLKEKAYRSFDGTVRLISELTDNHLINAYLRLRRNNESKELMDDFHSEIIKRKLNKQLRNKIIKEQEHLERFPSSPIAGKYRVN